MNSVYRFPHYFLFFWLAVLLSACSPSIDPDTSIQKGLLDLKAWDQGSHPTLYLNGDWEIYWHKLYHPDDFKKGLPSQPQYLYVPGTFNTKEARALGIQDKGYATLRLVLKNMDTNQQWGLMVPNHSTTHDIWINNTFYSGGGLVGTNRDTYYPKVRPHVIYFSTSQPQVEILVNWANFDYQYGGVLEKFVLGSARNITRYNQRVLGTDLFLIGVLFIMAIYHFTLFLLRRRERASLYFSILCMVIAIRTGFVGQYIFSQIFLSLDWYFQTRVAFVMSYLMLPSLAGFLGSLFRSEYNQKWIHALIYLHIPVVLTVVVLPAHLYSMLLMPYQVMAMLAVAYLAIGLIRAVINKQQGAGILVICFLIFIATVINDILVSNGLLNTPLTMAYGFVIFIFGQSFVLLQKLTLAFEKSEILSLDMELEVIKRTSELESERSRLKMQNEQMLGELAIARKIQSQLIPQSGPDNIAFFYKSMEMVGGDFFDFINLSGGKLGLFISDVSGHGVPAAFITTLIRSYTLQFSGIIDNPAEFLHFLNMTMFDQAGGNFVTAFYGIFDPKTRILNYASAGHNAPYVIYPDHLELLNKGRGNMPLLILKNHEMMDNDSMYQNYSLELSPGSKLFLYTDGLSETVSLRDQIRQEEQEVLDFESARLSHLFKQYAGMKCRELVYNIEKELISFRGGDEFDDDVCFICMDID